MTQLVTRVDDRLADAIDKLVEAGVVESRSDAVRRGLEILVDHHRRRRAATAIVESYRRRPQDDELVWSDQATIEMIADGAW
ncbi:MAG: ribbon-helix-helix domain-containing protein [Actinomycetota bacterium]|nr:ribbon-helix-helix domain-containing protein [Actinomycetota bacterium]